jgi:hypothetical protein
VNWTSGPKGTITRWVGTAAIVIGILVVNHNSGWNYHGRDFVVGMAFIGGGLLLRIEAALVIGLADRNAPTPQRVLPYDDAGN